MKKSELIKDLDGLLKNKFPNTIEKVILFGSRTNGKAKAYSDYDILVVLKTKSGWEIEDKIIDACYLMDLKYEILTDVKIISNEDLNSPIGMQPYIQHAIQHGISL
jgi:predicted nucleotidyltransferase